MMLHFSCELPIYIIVAVCGLITAVCVVTALLYRRKYCRLLKNIEHMIDTAADDWFTEQTLDESVWSSIECRFSKLIASLKVSERKAAEQHETIKEVVSNISHQTKTPIANILLYAELLNEEQISNTVRTYTQQLITQTEKLSFLTSALVNLSRLENGIISQNIRHSAVMPMLKRIYQQYLPAATEKQLDLFLEETDVTALFDKKWMHEAIANIVDNAVKYTNQGSIRIRTISFEMFVCIEIADTGKGIAEEEQAKVFQRFYRSPSFSETEGLGIGLYIARQIVSDTGGYIRLSSEPGEGSVFSIYLPHGTPQTADSVI